MTATDVERNIDIPGTGKRIYGTYREVPGAPLIVFSHGLTGDRNVAKFFIGARALSDAGYSSYRFDYYGYELDARDLVDCTMQDHAADLDLVVQTFKAEAPQRTIIVIGHSLGGMTILMSAQQRFDAAVLWDPTHTSAWEQPEHFDDDHTVWEPSLHLYRLRHGIDVLVNRPFLESYRLVDCDALARDFTKPFMVIGAGNGILVEGCKAYVEHATVRAELSIIKGADHNFTAGDSLERLLALTIEWLSATVIPVDAE